MLRLSVVLAELSFHSKQWPAITRPINGSWLERLRAQDDELIRSRTLEDEARRLKVALRVVVPVRLGRFPIGPWRHSPRRHFRGVSSTRPLAVAGKATWSQGRMMRAPLTRPGIDRQPQNRQKKTRQLGCLAPYHSDLSRRLPPEDRRWPGISTPRRVHALNRGSAVGIRTDHRPD